MPRTPLPTPTATPTASLSAGASPLPLPADAKTPYWPLGDDGHGSGGGGGGATALFSELGSNLARAFWPRFEPQSAGSAPLPPDWALDEGWITEVSIARAGAAYPFSRESLAQSFAPPSDAGTAAAWLATLDALDGGQHVKVTVIGGSMTSGNECCCREPCSPCSWASQLEAWLHLARPRWNVTVLNYGMGGTYDGWLTMLIEPADVFIIDTSVNTIQAGQSGMNKILAVSSIERIYDALLWRLLHMTAPALGGPPALLYLSTIATFHQKDHFVEQEAEVARYYGLAAASYRSAMGWDENVRPSDAELRFFWSRCNNIEDGDAFMPHPRKVTHELVSDVVKYAFLRLLSRRSGAAAVAVDYLRSPRASGRPPKTGYSSVGRPCASEPGGPLTALSPRVGFAPAAPPARGWRLYEDRPRKPGWIAGGIDAGGITFDVAFGEQPRLEISYLLSYTGMGAFNASVAIGPCTYAYLVNASYDPHETVRYSITQVAFLGKLPPPAAVVLGDFPAPACEPGPGGADCTHPCAPVNGRHYPLTITPVWASATGGKVKILGVTSC